jgi:hypothetical protein
MGDCYRTRDSFEKAVNDALNGLNLHGENASMKFLISLLLDAIFSLFFGVSLGDERLINIGYLRSGFWR